MAPKKIEAVKLTRQIRDQHYQALQGKSKAEILAFYQERAKQMNAKVKALTKAKIRPKARKLKAAIV